MKNKFGFILVKPQIGENIGASARSLKNFGFSNLSLLLIANLNFADRDRIFLSTSSFEALITLFLYSSNNVNWFGLFSGKYLDGLALFFEKLLKKYFTILSSMEWKLITKILPPGFNIFVAFIIPLINSVISLLTKILNAWKVLVQGLILLK